MIAYEILEEALVGPRCGKIVQGGGASLRFAAPFRGLVRRKDSDLSGRPAGRCGGQPTRIRPPTRICICWDSTGGDTVSAGCVARSSRLGQGKDTDRILSKTSRSVVPPRCAGRPPDAGPRRGSRGKDFSWLFSFSLKMTWARNKPTTRKMNEHCTMQINRVRTPGSPRRPRHGAAARARPATNATARYPACPNPGINAGRLSAR